MPETETAVALALDQVIVVAPGAVPVAGLAVIDMVKAVDPHAALRDVQVEAKDGGRNGAWRR